MCNIKTLVSSNPPRVLSFKIKLTNLLLYCRLASTMIFIIAAFLLMTTGFMAVSMRDLKDIVFVASIGSVGTVPFWFSLMIYCVLKGQRVNNLLEYGMLTSAKLKSKEKTNIIISGTGHVYKMIFEFKTIEKTTRKTILKSAEPKIVNKLDCDQQEPLLYDPANPSRTLLLISMPESLKASKNGKTRLMRNMKILMMFIAWLFLLMEVMIFVIYTLPRIEF